MMQQVIFEIVSNRALTPLIYEMRLKGDTSAITRPGQFVELSIEGLFLRRPISVCNFDEGELTLVYKVVGKGTADMAAMQVGRKVDVLTGLGNGFNADAECQRALLVGGGVGVPPLYRLARELLAKGREVTVVLGFNTAAELFYEEEFKALGVNLVVATVDGSKGVKGFVTDAIRESGVAFDYFYSCGPLPMLKALSQSVTADGELSLEERMGCGFGICMGCSIQTASGAKRVCKEGPVFKKEEILW
ncbi:MAG: dihydroorotate dehydrogenase electron transfer subunit [Alistipes sp.]|nr:dihydroorotate dehydrogenase electron transfer subunit [Alistipes sp.]